MSNTKLQDAYESALAAFELNGGDKNGSFRVTVVVENDVDTDSQELISGSAVVEENM